MKPAPITLEQLQSYGYPSFLAAFRAAKSNPYTRTAEALRFMAVPANDDGRPQYKQARELLVPLDYIKARAFEELLDILPAEETLSALVHDISLFLPPGGPLVRELKQIPTKWKEAI